MKRWALLILAAAVLVAMRLKFNQEYEGAPWETLVSGTAERPFGHRVLVPWLVRPFVDAGVSIRTAFAVTEWGATVAALTGMEAALRRFIEPKFARLGGGVFFVVLALAFLLPFKWPIFYPWDTPAIACLAWGVALADARKHGPLVALATIAAFNRESAVLLPLLTVALHATSEHRREAVRSASLQLAGIVLVRLAVGVLVPDAGGHVVHLRVAGMWRIDHNLRWLGRSIRALSILGAFSLLPALWISVRSHMPLALRRFELFLIPVAVSLLVVANVYEPRAWGEVLTLLFVGVVVGAVRWALGESSDEEPSSVGRWAPHVLLAATVVALVVWSVV